MPFIQGVHKFVPCLCGYCGGAVDSVFSLLGQLHSLSFNLEFETLFESIGRVVADLWQRRGKISGCFKNSTSVVLQECQNKVNLRRKGSSIVLRFLVILLKG